ncbi:hypothetical protein FGB62_112g216 [Gracilaria domingensis]|nr:hypothetical protein FGB62_112g216 [Gracilaria domingensis]
MDASNLSNAKSPSQRAGPPQQAATPIQRTCRPIACRPAPPVAIIPLPYPDVPQPQPILPSKDSSPKPKDCKERKSRAGAPNYSAEDVAALLTIVEEIEPTGAGNWAFVALRFSEWALENERPHREQISLRNKFDKLANTKIKACDPACPETIRRAKGIARTIHNKYASMMMEHEGGDDGQNSRLKPKHDEGCDATKPDSDIEDAEVMLPRAKKRKKGVHGAAVKLSSEELLVNYVGQMSRHLGLIAKSLTAEMSKSSEKDAKHLSKEDINEIVKREVRESMLVTNNILAKMNLMLENISAKLNGPQPGG